MKPRVAIISGGYSEEIVISVGSAQTLYQALQETDAEPYIVEITEERWCVKIKDSKYDIRKEDFSFQKGEERIHFDVAYPMIHGAPAENGILQGYFEMIGLPYVGSNVYSSALTFNKEACKSLVTDIDVGLAKSVLVSRHNRSGYVEGVSKLQFPVFVKPNKHGSSFGVSKVDNAEDLMDAVEKTFQFDDEVLVEEYIAGREFSCGVMELGGKLTALPVTEIISQNDFFDFEAKYQGKSAEITPAEIDESASSWMQDKSLEIYRATQCSGIARIDFILTENSELYMIEVNSIPGMSKESIIPQQIQAAGLSLGDVLYGLIAEAL